MLFLFLSDPSKDDSEAVCPHQDDKWEKKEKQKKVNKAVKHETIGNAQI